MGKYGKLGQGVGVIRCQDMIWYDVVRNGKLGQGRYIVYEKLGRVLV